MIEKSHSRSGNFNQGQGLPIHWMKFLPRGWDLSGSWWILFLSPLSGLILGRASSCEIEVSSTFANMRRDFLSCMDWLMMDSFSFTFKWIVPRTSMVMWDRSFFHLCQYEKRFSYPAWTGSWWILFFSPLSGWFLGPAWSCEIEVSSTFANMRRDFPILHGLALDWFFFLTFKWIVPRASMVMWDRSFFHLCHYEKRFPYPAWFFFLPFKWIVPRASMVMWNRSFFNLCQYETSLSCMDWLMMDSFFSPLSGLFLGPAWSCEIKISPIFPHVRNFYLKWPCDF